MLDQDGDETLDGSEHGTVDHDGTLLLVGSVDEPQIEAFGKHVIELNCAELVLAADGVANNEVDLRAVEGPLPLGNPERGSPVLQGAAEIVFGTVPQPVVPGAVHRTGREYDLHVAAEQFVTLEDHAHDAEYLVPHLLGRAEDVCVVLGKAAHAREPGHGSGELVAVEPAEIGESQRQIPVGRAPGGKHQAVRRAIHRLDGELTPVDLGKVHVLAVVLVVARTDPQ